MERYANDPAQAARTGSRADAAAVGSRRHTFTIQYANRLKELLPHAEGPVLFDRAGHFLQDDRGPDLAAAIIPFLKRTLDTKA